MVVAASLMASSQVDGAAQSATAQDLPPAAFQSSAHAGGRDSSPPPAAPPTAAAPSAVVGTATPPSASAPAATSGLAAGGIPSVAKAAYDSAAAAAPDGCGVDWSLVAAIGRVESDHGRFAGAVLQTDGPSAPRIIGIPLDGTGTALIRDTDAGRLDGDTVYDRAVGPMQFIPSTWARYASDGDGDGSSDPFDIQDAARATARYLCAAGGDLTTVGGQRRAVLAYNHSDSYAATVLTLAAEYAGTPRPTVPTDAVPPPSDPPAHPGAPLAVPQTVSPSPSGPPSATSPTTTTPPTSPPAAASRADLPPPTPPTVTTPPTTPPPVTVTTPPRTTTPPVTTPPTATAPPPMTPPVTTPPTTPPPATSPPVTSTPPPPTTAPPTTTPATTAPGCSTPAVESLGTVDVRDGSSDPAAPAAVAARVVQAGGTVGDVVTTQDTTSAVLYPDGLGAAATALAAALGVTGAAQVGPVDRITVVIGAGDAAGLVCAP